MLILKYYAILGNAGPAPICTSGSRKIGNMLAYKIFNSISVLKLPRQKIT